MILFLGSSKVHILAPSMNSDDCNSWDLSQTKAMIVTGCTLAVIDMRLPCIEHCWFEIKGYISDPVFSQYKGAHFCSILNMNSRD